jgi:O-antigen/teichoic acid export membrane protein
VIRLGGLAGLAHSADAEMSRSERRYRRAALTFAAWIAVKAVALVVLLLSVRWSIAYLGPERFGLWMTAMSAAGLLSFATLGFDRGLLSALAAADGRNNRSAARRLVSTATLMLGGVLALVGLLFAFLYPALPWAHLLNAAPEQAGEAGPVLAALVGSGLVLLFGSITETVQGAYQEGFYGGLWDAAGKLLGLGALALAIALRLSLAWLVLWVAAAPILAVAANTALLFGRQRPWLVPRFALMRRSAARRLFATGGLFFLIQLALTVAYFADNIIVAQISSSAAVADFSVTARLFDIPGMLLLLLTNALWPPLAEAIARGDRAWAERGLKHAIWLSLALVGACALPLMLVGPAILDWWLGGAIAAPPALFIAFGLFWLLSAVTQPISVFLNAAQAFRFQLACMTALALGSLALKLGLAPRFGIAGIAWGRVIAEALFRLLPYGLYLPRVLRRLRA